MRPADAANAEWQRLQPQTLVDLAIEAIIAGAAAGRILPGDRIVEAELARKLGVSRVPVREALRLLESQGVVVNEPYKGIRLRPVTNERVSDLIEARIALEASATARAVAAGRNRGGHLDLLRNAVDEMELMAARKDAYGVAVADTKFHRALCLLGGNSVTLDLWETLARQFTIIFGLATFGKPMLGVVEEHQELLAIFEAGNIAAIGATLDDHITVMNHAMDYEAIIARRRAEREKQ
ncbi:GntR family transcriptional regulator [Chelatococcus asaccharovorans]|uniref:GntR family transcriptional regulator n=2 Tax=Chelatococcus asaccharovorans TaxID=28210 RepID=A0A2V3UDR9_9HYPH|nr:GntR family transcriptional regulator [Chelatococcus asaccharovorans]MBS7702200.1 GntR family transcriptional regulator [Chelatococcus asaccharovorans]PXW56602.1 GntR family transcriptional regulator [Chelatococcus asaccharovorans]CAH1668602.1 GntR family transcriptional regulator [Chelatococcus asaccharovorans]CAH1679945.1 GntR family transcriptional regulator [Chelatococcus asaccharovorans]